MTSFSPGPAQVCMLYELGSRPGSSFLLPPGKAGFFSILVSAFLNFQSRLSHLEKIIDAGHVGNK